MPDLGPYAGPVFAAYGATLALLALIVALSWRRAARVRRDLAAVEARRKGAGDGRA